MHYVMNQDTVTITCTYEDLDWMAEEGEAAGIYASICPDTRLACELYLGYSRWRESDILIANREDFLKELGVEELRKPITGPETPVTITVPLNRRLSSHPKLIIYFSPNSAKTASMWSTKVFQLA